MTTSLLLWGALLGSVRLAAATSFTARSRGPLSRTYLALLMIFPYSISNTVTLVLAGAAIAALPYFVRL
jgi:hypothetical protein